ncbi:hypothetical protein Tdes44962_MAKER08929 [Teratosphaeria destructans]|uniref:Distal membrane-arm assembly complex protein 1-like domain-containing protein n=1 Tax=Teratosphaeria destructans TaxID=418781 RepID=A0A9W7SUW8_9PEZI|nr:hypothetical protein Tdes44962_MAKER08929 [Teratosphaeria destructans]
MSDSSPINDPLAPPAPVKNVIAQQRADYDCTPCRIMGSLAFTGLGIYTYGSGMRQLRAREMEILRSGTMFGVRVRRGGILALSASLVGLGVYRLVD